MRLQVEMLQKAMSRPHDESARRLFSACRSGAIDVLDTQSGKELQWLPIPQGVDDLVFDPASKRLYAACRGDGGAVTVYHEEDADEDPSLGKIASGSGRQE